MMVSYYNESELEAAKKVSDKELNELLQEIREKDDRYYLIERKFTIKNGWFKKHTEKIGYTLLFNTHSCECQIVNFCQDHELSINGTVSKSYIYTLFCGWLNGYKRVQERYTACCNCDAEKKKIMYFVRNWCNDCQLPIT